MDGQVEEFTVGTDPALDLDLVPYDCRASVAHAKMLQAIGILSRREFFKLEKELKNILRLSRKKAFFIRTDEEDCHTAIENHLRKKLGKTGEKIHTARSRNDQVLTALRLYSKERLGRVERALLDLVRALKTAGRRYQGILMPGYTHSRKAMPYSVGKYFRAFQESLQDDLRPLRLASSLNDQNPLGSVAGYGVGLKIDRDLTTRLLNFKKKQNNELYCQNSRGKFESLILFALSQIMQDLQKLATDLILFSMEEFGYFRLPDEFCTGSSVMPHKKNPDVLELVRAKSAVIHSYFFQITEIIRGLPSGYHRDLQLTKEPLMNGFRVAEESIKIMTRVVANLKVNRQKCREACTEEVYSVEKANALAREGIAFREAYRRLANSR